MEGDGIKPAISPSRNGFDVTRIFGVIIQGLAQFVDRNAQAVVAILNRIAGPYSFANLVAGDDFTAVLQQSNKNSKGLLLQPHDFAVSSQFPSTNGQLKGSEAKDTVQLQRGEYRRQLAPRCKVERTTNHTRL